MASTSIDLFGGSAVSQVADIARESIKICDALYASYQMLIKMLDEQCRPLLEQEPEYYAVREVRDLIKWLNDESEIENNFTASLNSHSLGGVASGRYIPSIENKMIQTFWEGKYDMWPGRAEAEADERQKKMEAAEQKKRDMEQKRKEEEATYEKEYKEWKQKFDAIEKRRSDEIEKHLTTAKETRLKEIETKYTKEFEDAMLDKFSCEQSLKEEESKLASLGTFKFAEKKAAKKTIEEIKVKISGAIGRIETAEQICQNEKKELSAWLDKRKGQLQKEIEKTLPIPPKPRKTYYFESRDSLTPMQFANNCFKQDILNEMYPGHLYTATEIQSLVDEFISTKRFSETLRQLEREGKVKCVKDRNIVYFTIVE